MADLIIIRLHPTNPTDAASFTNYLTNLSIAAFDLSFVDSRVGNLVGSAAGAWSAPSNVLFDPADPNLIDFTVGGGNPRIFQHYSVRDISFLPIPFVELELVATAVIEVNLPAPIPEYQTSDLRLELTNNGRTIVDTQVDFNVSIVSVAAPLPTDPAFYMGRPPTSFQPTLPRPDFVATSSLYRIA